MEPTAKKKRGRPRVMTAKQVLEARKLREEGMKYDEILAKLDLPVSLQALRAAIAGKTYSDI